MVSYKKLKNILKYSSFVEIAMNSNNLFASDNKKSGGCCNFTKEDDKNKKKEEENKNPIQTPVQTPEIDSKKQQLIKECKDLIVKIKKLDSKYGKTVNENDSVEKLTNFKTELQNDLNNLNNKKSKEEKINECRELEKEIQKINPDFKIQTIPNENPENLDKIKNDLEKKLDFLDPNKKLKDNEKKPEEKQSEEKQYFSDKLAIKEIMNKILGFVYKAKKEKSIKSVKKEDLEECTGNVKAKLEDYKKNLEGIKKSLGDLDYEKASEIYKKTSEMQLDFEVVTKLAHYQQNDVCKLLGEESKKFWGNSRENVKELTDICKDIYDVCNPIIKKHDEEELNKKIEEEKLNNLLSDIKWSLNGIFECISRGDGVFLMKDGVEYGRYRHDGFWLKDFNFFIKRSDLKNYISEADKLEFNDKNFIKDRILIAFNFWTINTINAPVIKILLDLKNKKIFVYDNKEVYFVGEDNFMNLCKGAIYDEKKDEKKYYEINHSCYFSHIESNKFNFRYMNNY